MPILESIIAVKILAPLVAKAFVGAKAIAAHGAVTSAVASQAVSTASSAGLAAAAGQVAGQAVAAGAMTGAVAGTVGAIEGVRDGKWGKAAYNAGRAYGGVETFDPRH